MKSLAGPIVKSIVFVAVTVVATGLLALTITNGSVSGNQHYKAIFTDVTSLNVGDDIRMAGVRVGQVTSIGIEHRTEAEVGFSLQSGVRLARTASATVRYRNLIGQRYIELDEGAGSLRSPLPNGATIPRRRTHPALDLTVLFNGFQPLFEALDPKEINQLSGQIIEVFQGQGPTIDDLLAQTATLTDTLASKDRVIGKVIDNLNSVLSVVNSHGTQLSDLVSALRRLVSGLAQDRAPLGKAISGVAGLTNDVGGLLEHGRKPLKQSITSLGQLSANLAGSSGALNSFLVRLPGKLNAIGRLASYGSWLNFYLCSVTGRIPVPADYGNPSSDPNGQPNPSGLVGVQPVEKRCQT